MDAILGTNSGEGIAFSKTEALHPEVLASFNNATVWESLAPCFIYGRDPLKNGTDFDECDLENVRAIKDFYFGGVISEESLDPLIKAKTDATFK